MTPPEEGESNLQTILYRLNSMDKHLERLEGRLDRIEGGMATLQFVGVALYASEQKAQDDRIDAAAKLAMWALGLVCSLTISAIIALAVRLATA